MLEVRKLDCARAGRTIVQDLTFDLRGGEIMAVLGNNGAGKSTLLATLSGELAPQRGELRLLGRPLDAWAARERAMRMAVLPQSSTLAFAFTAQEVVAMGRLPHASGAARDAAIINEVMAAADVAHLAQRNYLTLSGGERQRVHLARVMAQVWEGGADSCLLLDEPTAALDLAHQQTILRQARTMAERGAAVLIILHDINLAARYADRIMLLDEGRMAALGTPWEVLDPDRIEEVFGVAVQVVRHPLQDCPLVII